MNRTKRVLAAVLVALLAATSVFAATVSYDAFLTDATSTLASAIGKSTKVAVTEINADSPAFASRLVADLEKNLINSDCIVLNRSSIDKVIGELEFQTSGLVDDDEAVSIGHMLGANLIVTGTAKNMVSYYHVELQLIDVETTYTKRQLSFDLKYDQNLKNILSETSARGSQKASVGARAGFTFQFNKAHEDMVGSNLKPTTKSPVSPIVTLDLSYRVFGEVRVGAEATLFTKNGVTVKNFKAGSVSTDIEVTYSTLDIPVLLSVRIMEKPTVVDIIAGGYVSIPTSDGNIRVVASNASGALNMTGLVYGVMGGFSTGIPTKNGQWVLDARFLYDLNYFKVTGELIGAEPGGVVERKGLTVSAGYRFSL